MFSSMAKRVLSINAARRAVFAVSAFAAVATFASAATAPSADAAAFCKSGYVWREAFAGDFACVTPQDRQTVKNENAAAWSHTAANRYCYSGYVWRETRPSDLTCVVPAARTREVSNNANAVFRVADPRQTPSGGVSNYTQYDSTGGWVHVSGGGLTPGGAVKFYAMGPWSGPYSMGTLTANGSGAVNDWIGHLSCWRNQNPATIIVADQRTGNVTTAGANYAINHCG